MPRIRHQLAIQASPDLLARLRAAAEARHRTVTSLALEWIENGLEGLESPPAVDPALPEVLQRLEALEAAVTALRSEPRSEPRSAPMAVPLAVPGSQLTSAELAARTGTSRAAWNNWANPERIGTVRTHASAGSWRLVGKVAADPGAGGPARWLWEPA